MAYSNDIVAQVRSKVGAWTALQSFDTNIEALQYMFEWATGQAMFKQKIDNYIDVRNRADNAYMGLRASNIHALTEIIIENIGAGANPVLNSNDGNDLLNVSGVLRALDRIQWLDGLGFYGQLAHANTGHRTYTHQDKSYTVADHADVTLLENMLALGVANKQSIACIPYTYDVLDNFDLDVVDMTMQNLSNADTFLAFAIPLPTTKGGKKLYISDIYMQVIDADAGDMIEGWFIYGMHAGHTIIASDATDTIAPGERSTTGLTVDCSSYDYIILVIDFTLTNAGDMNFELPRVYYYYDT